MRRSSIALLLLGTLAACGTEPGDDVDPSDVTAEMLRGYWVSDLPNERLVFQFVQADGYYEETRGRTDVAYMFQTTQRGLPLRLIWASDFDVVEGAVAETVIADLGGAGVQPGTQFSTAILGFKLDTELVLASKKTSDGRRVFRRATDCPHESDASGWAAYYMKPGYDPHYFDGFDAVAMGTDGAVHAIASSTGSCGVGCPRPPNPPLYVSTAGTCGVRTHALGFEGFPYNPVMKVRDGRIHAAWNDVGGAITYATKPVENNLAPASAFTVERVTQMPSAAAAPLLAIGADGEPVVALVGTSTVWRRTSAGWQSVEATMDAAPFDIARIAADASGTVWVASAQLGLGTLGVDGTVAAQAMTLPTGLLDFTLDRDGKPVVALAGALITAGQGGMVNSAKLSVARWTGTAWATTDLGQGLVPKLAVDDRNRVVVAYRWDNYRGEGRPQLATIDGTNVHVVRPWAGDGFTGGLSSDSWGWSPMDLATGPNGQLAITGGMRGYLSIRPQDASFENRPQKVKIDLDGDGGGRVVLVGTGKSCTSDCEVELEGGLVVSVAFEPDENSQLASVSGCRTTSGTTCEILALDGTQLSATFVNTPWKSARTPVGNGNSFFTAVVDDGAGGVIAVGNFYREATVGERTYDVGNATGTLAVRLGADDAITWSRRLQFVDTNARAVAATSAGDLLVFASANAAVDDTPSPLASTGLLKLAAADGSIADHVAITAEWNLWPYGVAALSNGGVLVVARSSGVLKVDGQVVSSAADGVYALRFDANLAYVSHETLDLSSDVRFVSGPHGSFAWEALSSGRTFEGTQVQNSGTGLYVFDATGAKVDARLLRDAQLVSAARDAAGRQHLLLVLNGAWFEGAQVPSTRLYVVHTPGAGYTTKTSAYAPPNAGDVLPNLFPIDASHARFVDGQQVMVFGGETYVPEAPQGGPVALTNQSKLVVRAGFQRGAELVFAGHVQGQVRFRSGVAGHEVFQNTAAVLRYQPK